MCEQPPTNKQHQRTAIHAVSQTRKMETVTTSLADVKITVPDDTSGGKKTPAPKGFARRDHLRSIEETIQKKWHDSKIFEAHYKPGKPKYFLNFPYPYMNGRLHLGHAFSFTKAEFTARFQRLQGKNVLLPFAFHCTGMPIQAAANKLRDEIKQFGCPPVFKDNEEENAVEDAAPVEEKSAESAIAAKSKGKKTKLLVKGLAGKPMRQWDILTKMVEVDTIPEFAEPLKWLNYFPPFGASDLQAFGSAVDWRRSFITTSVNPFYDAFIRWQFNRLKEGNRIKFGKRANVFSILDGQVCADHDRATGEGVGPQEYTIIKLVSHESYYTAYIWSIESMIVTDQTTLSIHLTFIHSSLYWNPIQKVLLCDVLNLQERKYI